MSLSSVMDIINKEQNVKDPKKLIDKLKKVCTTMASYNLNSPSLLQFIRVDGIIEVILTHNPTNGDNINFYKVFSTVTADNYYIDEEDTDCFKCSNDKLSIPIIVSSYDFSEEYSNKSRNFDNVINKSHFVYDICLDSFYVFPKFLLKAIKEDIITDFKTVQRSFDVGHNTFNMDIIYDNTNDRYKNTLFIRNNSRLNNIYNLSILPFDNNNSSLVDLYTNYDKDWVSFTKIDEKTWNELFTNYKYLTGMVLKGINDQNILVYHHEFVPKKCENIEIYKHYESDKGNIVSL